MLPLVAPVGAQAQTWPSGPIRFIVPFPPGGSTDALARVVQMGLQQRLGANIIIENRPGASGAAGTAVFAKSPPDGNTWLLVFDTHSVNPYLMNLQYDTEKDLDPVMLVASLPYHVVRNVFYVGTSEIFGSGILRALARSLPNAYGEYLLNVVDHPVNMLE